MKYKEKYFLQYLAPFPNKIRFVYIFAVFIVNKKQNIGFAYLNCWLYIGITKFVFHE